LRSDTLYVTRRAAVPDALKLGFFTRADARRAGLTGFALRSTPWVHIGNNLYRWEDRTVDALVILESVRERLPTAVFSGNTAGWLHGLDVPPCDPVEATVPKTAAQARLSGVRTRWLRLSAREVANRQGFPLTSPVRTVFDLSTRCSPIEGVAVADMALHAGLVTEGELQVFAHSRRRIRGIARLRKLLQLVEPKSESPMESRLRMILDGAGLPRPEAQVDIHDHHGQFIGRVDLFYRDARLAIEYDGEHHRDKLVEDNRRQNQLLAAGINLLRFTAPDLADRHRVAAQIGAELRKMSVLKRS
jgi:hypothetical protein